MSCRNCLDAIKLLSREHYRPVVWQSIRRPAPLALTTPHTPPPASYCIMYKGLMRQGTTKLEYSKRARHSGTVSHQWLPLVADRVYVPVHSLPTWLAGQGLLCDTLCDTPFCPFPNPIDASRRQIPRVYHSHKGLITAAWDCGNVIRVQITDIRDTHKHNVPRGGIGQ